METRALLVMDMQNGIVERLGEEAPLLLARLAEAVAAARAAELPIIFVRVAFRPRAPEVSGRNLIFSAYAGSEGLGEASPATQIHPALAPRDDEVVVVKKRVSAFSGSDLEVVLRSSGIDALVLTGLATSGVVLSTLREAADRDFVLTVLSDGCHDRDEEVHRVLMEKVFPRQATVLTTATWIAGLGAPDGNG